MHNDLNLVLDEVDWGVCLNFTQNVKHSNNKKRAEINSKWSLQEIKPYTSRKGYMDAYGYNKPGIKPLLMITKPKEQNKNENQQMQRDG